MNIFVGILCFVAGMTVDAFYNHRKQIAEADAYMRGYNNSKKEEQFFKNGIHEGRVQEMFRRPVEVSPPRHAKANIPESFVNNMHQNGQATMKLQ